MGLLMLSYKPNWRRNWRGETRISVGQRCPAMVSLPRQTATREMPLLHTERRAAGVSPPVFHLPDISATSSQYHLRRNRQAVGKVVAETMHRWADAHRSPGSLQRLGECPRLARGMVTLVATESLARNLALPLGWRRLRRQPSGGIVIGGGDAGRRGSGEREAPTGKPWASSAARVDRYSPRPAPRLGEPWPLVVPPFRRSEPAEAGTTNPASRRDGAT